MKKIFYVFVPVMFVIFSFGFISQGHIDESNVHPCPYVQQLKTSSDGQIIFNDEKKINECPYLNSKKTECPFIKEGTKEIETGKFPYSEKKEINSSNKNHKVRLLETKIS